MGISNEALNKFFSITVLGLFAAAIALIVEKKDKFDTSIKVILEGLTIALGFLSFINFILLFTKKNFKTNILFLLNNIMICGFSIAIIVIYSKDEKNDKTDTNNIIFLTFISLAALLTLYVILNDVFSFNLLNSLLSDEKK